MRWAVWPSQSQWLLLQVPDVCPRDGVCTTVKILPWEKILLLSLTQIYYKDSVLTYPDQKLEGVDSIIYSPLNVIHQAISGASDHHCGYGTILFLCLQQSRPHRVKPKPYNNNYPVDNNFSDYGDLPCLKTTTWVSPNSVRYTLSQRPISSGVGAV